MPHADGGRAGVRGAWEGIRTSVRGREGRHSLRGTMRKRDEDRRGKPGKEARLTRCSPGEAYEDCLGLLRGTTPAMGRVRVDAIRGGQAQQPRLPQDVHTGQKGRNVCVGKLAVLTRGPSTEGTRGEGPVRTRRVADPVLPGYDVQH